MQYLPDSARVLMVSGLLPAAFIAIVLNLILPEDLAEEATDPVAGGLSGKESWGKSPEGVPLETPRH